MISITNDCKIQLIDDYFDSSNEVYQDNLPYVVTKITVTILNYKTNTTTVAELIDVPTVYNPVINLDYGTLDNGVYDLNDLLFNGTTNKIQDGVYKITIKKSYIDYNDEIPMDNVLIDEKDNIVILCSTICCSIKASANEGANVCEIWALVEALKNVGTCNISGYDVVKIWQYLKNQINLINCGC